MQFFDFVPTKCPSLSIESETRSVMSNSLRPQGLYSLWNSPGQNTGVGSSSLLQEIFPTQGENPGLLHCTRMLCQPAGKAITSVWTLKKIQMNLFTKEKQTHRHRKQNYGFQRGSRKYQLGLTDTHLYIKKINHKLDCIALGAVFNIL